MQYYAYHTESEAMVEQLDKEFEVVVVVGGPEDGYSDGYDLAVYDARSKEEIAKEIQQIYTEPGRKA